MQSRVEQRSVIKFGVLLGKKQYQIHRELKAAYGEDKALSKGQINMWFHRFRQDPDAPVTDRKRPGMQRCRNTQTDQVLEFLEGDRRATVCQVAGGTGVPKTTVHRILKNDLNYSKIAPKMVPRVLTLEQMQCRKTISETNLNRIHNDPQFFRKLVTMDESWIFTYDPRTKVADLQWCSPVEPRPVKALRARSTSKTMLVLFFDDEGVVHLEFKDQGTIDTVLPGHHEKIP